MAIVLSFVAVPSISQESDPGARLLEETRRQREMEALAQAANEAGGNGDMGKLVHGILRAVWAEEKNVAEDAVIRDCLTAAGFDPALADSGLLTGAMAFEKNTEEAIQVGAFGAPFYIVDGSEKFWGQDRLDDLDAYLGGAL